ncbi:hypothetical protein AC578_6306 [Pseudocercospora eumusae]|uniref:N-terminal of MaoC-like dehydratase domain-containing protein n=1 Tax=Pseudocercospora eumusae TaxID=321146 RepID=A0A139H1Y4_9PEZI|nr:hypothetical protein AC578_6306 [Pseudocercospora eumusae]
MAATRHATRVLGRVMSPKQQQIRHMSQSQPRLSKTPEEIAQAFLAKFGEGQSFARKQLLDANQARLFSLTLDREKFWPHSESLIDGEPKAGTPLPAGYHNAYFTPTQLPAQLGVDGTDTSYNPEAPFTRRMWAGGSISWPGAGNPSNNNPAYLKIGDTATEITKVLSCDAKTLKNSGEAMLVVGVVKEFYDSNDELCVVDRRNWVFREALDAQKKSNPPPPATKKKKQSEMQQQKTQNEGTLLTKPFQRTPTQLFRISALTFNAHRIHYDRTWAVEVEGHRDVVVHGPLNMISCLDFWRDEVGKSAKKNEVLPYLYPKSLEYRATSPVYVEEPYKILMERAAIMDENVAVEVVGDDGRLCMKGEIRRW